MAKTVQAMGTILSKPILRPILQLRQPIPPPVQNLHSLHELYGPLHALRTILVQVYSRVLTQILHELHYYD